METGMDIDRAMAIAQTIVQIRVATPEDDNVIAEHFYQMWLDNQIPAEVIKPDWLPTVCQFIQQARETLNYRAFIAEVDGRIVGSAGCQRYAGLYPDIIQENHRYYGYIWGVYVEPNYRRNGIAKTLTQQTVNYLKSIGCTRAILNASPSGTPVYDRIGFVPSNAMQLDLI